MTYTVDTIIQNVRTTIDRNRRNNDLLPIDINTQMLDEAIWRNITDGVRMVLMVARKEFIGDGVSFPDTSITWMAQGVGSVPLPEDMLRFISFKMDDWAQACTVLEDETSPAYGLMHSPIKALRGVSERPRIFDVAREGGRVLEFYSSDSEEAHVQHALYLPLPLITKGETQEEIDIPLLCYGACIAQIGALALSERGNNDAAQVLQEEAKTLIA